ncbi:MAG: amidohydrolase family protein [Planctomycetia bacterium]|nr:amidohydrolase family protein [Planctomycetia bacterium]
MLLARCVVACGADNGTAPVQGLHDRTPSFHALVGGRIVVAPGRVIEKGTLVFRDGLITAVGAEAKVPSGATVSDVTGRTLYAGFIDAYSEQAIEAPRPANGAWNSDIAPQLRVDEHYKPAADLNKKYRSQGFALRLVAPAGGIVKGTSAVVTAGDETPNFGLVQPQAGLHVRMTPVRGSSNKYPDSPMGALALVRQTFHDGRWYTRAWDAHRTNPTVPRPESNSALAELEALRERKLPLIVDASDVLYFLRADAVGREFDLPIIVRGSGTEYQRLDAVRASGRPVIVPLRFPGAPAVADAEAAMSVSLEALMHWDLAPENPGRLAGAGVRIALTTHGLKDQATFLAALRKAIERGLTADDALRALTTVPADLFGIGNRYGTLEVGKSASFTVVDGDLFTDAKAKIHETWVDGHRHLIVPLLFSDLRGRWNLEVRDAKAGEKKLELVLEGDADKLTGKLLRGGKESPLKNVAIDGGQWAASLKGEPLDWKGEAQLSATILTARHDEREQAPTTLLDGTLTLGDGSRFAWQARRAPAETKKEETKKPEEKAEPKKPLTVSVEDDDAGPAKPQAAAVKPEEKKVEEKKTEEKKPEDKKPDEKPKRALYPVNYPLGDYGVEKPLDQTAAPAGVTAFVGATVWTCGKAGKIENAVVLVELGRIKAVGRDLAVPAGATVVDVKGKHLTPGIIDCHSHIATDGGVNEASHSVTSEVRIADFIDPHDINIYRQLAGGVTASNILHGSANTIGGQNQVLKFRWGGLPEEMKFAAAPPGIKFALGENVKQSNWGPGNNRYPQSRMGVEQLLRDSFRAAGDYKRRWKEYRSLKRGLPPRVDLQMDALVEVLDGKRLVHCHSYRQDEIIAFLRVCEEFHVRVATLQHILEGYKTADAMAKHGVGGSSFADWWAYKFEVYDAIPYNGALMHQAGVVVSFNSDDAELARRLNLEAAKAVKYGGVAPEEALKFVTLNPAKQLGVDKYVGSIEPGKDADLAVWSASPLSSVGRCEQTWIDGRKYFDRADDQRRREETALRRAALIQRVLASGDPVETGDGDKSMEWARDDIYCGCRSPHVSLRQIERKEQN